MYFLSQLAVPFEIILGERMKTCMVIYYVFRQHRVGASGLCVSISLKASRVPYTFSHKHSQYL